MVASLNELISMRKLHWITLIVTVVLAGLLAVTFSSSLAASDELTMVSPESCPSGGCAAGQRINFNVSFSVDPQYTSGVNTQVCIYATSSWADYSDGWISSTGLETGKVYTSGEYNSICTSHVDSGEEWIAGAYTSLSAGTNTDQLEFALRIHADAAQNGLVKVKVFQADSSGAFQDETTNLTKSIKVATGSAKASTVYVAETAEDCDGHTDCYVNSGENGAGGVGTGLYDAIHAVSAGSEILILGDYPIKSETVVVDKDVTISGFDSDSTITYGGDGDDCSNPMLSFTSGGTLKDLVINDGNCTSPSRHLIEVNSDADVTIEHNTLDSGNRAINILDNTGDVSIAFNQISDNLSYAVYRQSGSGGTVEIFANNIIDNRSGIQVNCNNLGTADHNYWGEGITATNSASNCTVDDGKQLGAPIVLSSDGAGVEAVRQTVTGTTKYAFNNKIGVKRTGGSDYDVIIVNHGQGSEENIPFLEEGSGAIEACSNFYDVFLADGASASDLVLTLKYDLNSSCISTIESSDYCGQSDSSEYPLWWYDPANDITDGWDRTGQNPEGIGAGDTDYGQVTTCNLTENTISVTIDNSGKPGISDDLVFTPFVVGLPLSDGVDLSEFTVTFDVTENDLRWTTSSEVNIEGFHILRSDTKNGTYSRVSSLIDAIGNTFIGGIYNFTDEDVQFTRMYYYKLEVVDDSDNTIEIYGPVGVLTATGTPTPTLTRTATLTRTPTKTRTSYATRTATTYYYRSPTSYYRASTSTPRSDPTQVRTYGPSSTPSRTSQSSSGTTTISDEDNSYPVATEVSWATEGYPAPEEEGFQGSSTPTPDDGVSDQDTEGSQTDASGSDEEETTQDQANEPVQWEYLLLGAAGGLVFLAAVSFFLAKFKFS